MRNYYCRNRYTTVLLRHARPVDVSQWWWVCVRGAFLRLPLLCIGGELYTTIAHPRVKHGAGRREMALGAFYRDGFLPSLYYRWNSSVLESPSLSNFVSLSDREATKSLATRRELHLLRIRRGGDSPRRSILSFIDSMSSILVSYYLHQLFGWCVSFICPLF